MNYTELTQAIQDYCESTETTFVAQIPTFVRQTEERINRAVLIPDLRKNATATFTSGDKYLKKPDDYLATASMATNDGTDDSFLLNKEQNFISEAYPTGATGVPKFYAHFDDTNFVVGPEPDSNYYVRLHYYYDPESIVTAATSWLGDNAESALLYGCLVEGYTFLKGDADLLGTYNDRYDGALNDLEALGMIRLKRDDYREGEPRRRLPRE
jgi:hypothetical protein